MFNLTAHTMRQPMMDEPYKRHLRTADVFDEVHTARKLFFKEQERACRARLAERSARDRYEAAIAKARLMQAMEDL